MTLVGGLSSSAQIVGVAGNSVNAFGGSKHLVDFYVVFVDTPFGISRLDVIIVIVIYLPTFRQRRDGSNAQRA